MDPKEQARNALDELGITSLPINPKEICKTLGITYLECPLEGFEGTLIVGSQSRALIGINEAIREPGRKNFTCAHELGHYYMDVGPSSATRIQCTKETIETNSPNIEIERRANIFASELLMPDNLILSLLNGGDPSWELISQIGRAAQTSLSAACNKFLDVTDHACVLVVSSNQRIEWSRKSKAFTGWIKAKNTALSGQTQALRAFVDSEPSSDFEVAQADDWLVGDRIDPNLDLLEWSLPINSYGQVLTLLWDEDRRASWNQRSSRREEADQDDDDPQGPIWEPPTFHRSKRRR